MRRLTRGDFMRLAALGGTAVATGGMLNACAGSRGSSSPADSSGSSQTTGQATEGGPGPTPGSDTTSGKALVAVFSQYGHTLAVANHINQKVTFDLFRIEPAEAYTSDYNSLLDVAKGEQDQDARPAMAATVETLADYGTIYLGYPVWWYDAPQIVKSFLDANDLSGKTVHPFSTSGGSNISITLDKLRAICPGMDLREGLTIPGSSVESHMGDVDAWLNA